MTHIIVGDAFQISQSHGQYRLGAIQGLNLALFVGAQHQRVIGRVQVQADDVSHLLDKERIGGKFETARAVRLQGEGLKQPMHRGFESPLAWEARRTVQCVPAAGLRDSVRFSRLAIWSSPMLRGRPGRSSSYRPVSPC